MQYFLNNEGASPFLFEGVPTSLEMEQSFRTGSEGSTTNWSWSPSHFPKNVWLSGGLQVPGAMQNVETPHWRVWEHPAWTGITQPLCLFLPRSPPDWGNGSPADD